MKKKHNSSIGASLLGFFLFFATITITSTASIFVYDLVNKASKGNLVAISFAVLGMIVVGAFLCVLCDIVRRKYMVEKPAKQILNATDQIACGNFDVKLIPRHEYLKYDQYDLIFENINTMTAELAKQKLLHNDFISNVSHEIKTPLSIIQNYAQSLQNSNLSNEKKEEYLQGLIAQTKRLSDLIANILKLNKLENQRLIPEFSEVDLAELLRISTLSFESLFEKKNLELVCDIDEVKMQTSATLLEIVFNNLISNAIKFTDNKGKVSISLKDDKNYAYISVSDTGCGISNETGNQIFDKFFQGDTSHSGEGNGLGLALVKQVIDILGGEISVKSKLGEGSTFTIKLKKEK
ncbi:MAG: HAMP domain-containing histidine kinase [Clostridia bacterium]|nr:HAMP domain-containing histidine kinase [Clostridia bacterium]